MEQTKYNSWDDFRIIPRDTTPPIKVTWSKMELNIQEAQILRQNYLTYPNPKIIQQTFLENSIENQFIIIDNRLCKIDLSCLHYGVG